MKNAPKHLSSEAKKTWQKLSDEFNIDDNAGLLLLQTAMEAFDRMRQAQAQIRADGMTISDRFGQPKPHPLLITERDARSALLAALKALRLDPTVIAKSINIGKA